MFERLRKMVRLTIWIIVVAFVGTIFAVWGAKLTRRGVDYAAKVDGATIPLQSFQALYNAYYNTYARVQDLDKDFLRRLRKRVLEQLVREHILIKFAEDVKIPVMDEEVIDAVKELFKDKEGKFDKKSYKFYLKKAPSSWWQSIERREWRKILLHRLSRLIKDTEIPSREEAMWQSILKEQKLSVLYKILKEKEEAEQMLKDFRGRKKVFTPSSLRKEFGHKVLSSMLLLEEGDVAGPFKVKGGYLIIKLLKRELPSTVPKREDVERLLWQYEYLGFEDFYTLLKQQKKIKINKALIGNELE